MVVIATFFVYFTFQTCEIVMEKGIESHGKVMEKSWKSHGISLRHSCGNPVIGSSLNLAKFKDDVPKRMVVSQLHRIRHRSQLSEDMAESSSAISTPKPAHRSTIL